MDSPEISSARCRRSGSESSSAAPHRERCTRTWDASQWRLVISESAWSYSAGWIARFPVTPAPTTGSGSHRGPQSESRIETTAGSWGDRGWRPDQSSTPVPTRYDAASASQFCFPIAIRKCRSLAGAEAHDVVVSVARSQERSSPDGTSPRTRKSSAARASAGDVLAPALRFKSGSARREAGQTQRRLLSRPIPPNGRWRPVSLTAESGALVDDHLDQCRHSSRPKQSFITTASLTGRTSRASIGGVRVHRGVLQPPAPALHPRDALARRLRTTTTLAARWLRSIARTTTINIQTNTPGVTQTGVGPGRQSCSRPGTRISSAVASHLPSAELAVGAASAFIAIQPAARLRNRVIPSVRPDPDPWRRGQERAGTSALPESARGSKAASGRHSLSPSPTSERGRRRRQEWGTGPTHRPAAYAESPRPLRSPVPRCVGPKIQLPPPECRAGRWSKARCRNTNR